MRRQPPSCEGPDAHTPQVRWAVVGLLGAGLMIAYFERVNLSVVLAIPEFKRHFGLSDLDRGVLNSAFFWSYALLQIPAGWWVDRFGVKRSFAGGLFLWSIVSVGTAFAGSLRQLVGLRLLLGLGESVVIPAGMRWIRFCCPENQRGLAIGLFTAASKLGASLGAPLAAWLVVAYGWRGMFVVLGIGSLLWLVPWHLAVSHDGPDAPTERADAAAEPGISFSRVLASPMIWGTVIGTFSYQYFVYYCLTWLPAYFVERRNLSLDSMGWYTMFTFLGMAVVAVAAGFAADRLIERGCDAVRVRRGFTIAGFLVASTEVIGAMSGSDSVALFFAVFSLAGLGLTTPNYFALTQTLVPGQAVGRIIGLQNCAGSIPGIVAPLLTGWLKQASGGYEAPMQAIWLFLILGIASYALLVRREYAPQMPGPAPASAS